MIKSCPKSLFFPSFYCIKHQIPIPSIFNTSSVPYWKATQLTYIKLQRCAKIFHSMCWTNVVDIALFEYSIWHTRNEFCNAISYVIVHNYFNNSWIVKNLHHLYTEQVHPFNVKHVWPLIILISVHLQNGVRVHYYEIFRINYKINLLHASFCLTRLDGSFRCVGGRK